MAVPESKSYKKSRIRKLLPFIVWLWDFIGLRFIIVKITPPRKEKVDDPQYKPPSTFFIWVVGIYVAFFGVASQQYEYKVDLIENSTNAVLTLLVKDEVRKIAINRVSSVQNMVCPRKPDILNPIVTFGSLFGKTQYHKETIDILKSAIVGFKKELSNANLFGAKLEGADLMEAKLEGTNLGRANLERAYLSRADLMRASLEGTDLGEAYLMGANLERANLERAYLSRADLMEAKLEGTDLGGANLERAYLKGAIGLTIDQLSRVKTLYEAKLDTKLMEQIKEKYPHLLEKPK